MEKEVKYPLLETINSPSDLRKLPEKQLPQLCKELRNFIIDSLANNPGHFASSLGSVELTVALHYVYSTPEDKIVWDVGHQAYGHKILTGRRDRFHTNRKLGGIKPFPSPDESEYDSFVAGHASNSISAALGLSAAATLEGRNEHVVAVIGDGSMSGGLAYEGLNNLSATPNNLLIIMNDNNMSISDSVGGMKQLLISMHSSKTYNKIRYAIAKGLRKMHILNERRANAVIRFNNGLKAMLFRKHNFFEGMSARYFGPINGHDVHELVGEGVKVWPNPATEFIYVDAPENASIEVYSVDGRMIIAIPANSASENNLIRQIDTYNLTAGVYVVNITTANGTQSLKFVKE